MDRSLLILKLFHRAAKTQRKRMLLTVMAIAWGTTSIVLLLSFGEGLKRNMQIAQKGLGSGILIAFPGETLKAFAGFPQGRAVHFLPEDAALLKETIPEIKAISAEMLSWGIQVSNGKTTLNKTIAGVHPEFGEMRSHFPQAGGRFLNERDFRLRRRVIFLGDELKKDLFGHKPAVGGTILLNQVPFTVVGVMQAKMQHGMYSGPDEDNGVIPLSTFKALYGRQRLFSMVIQPAFTDQSEYVKQRIREVLGARYHFDPSDSRAVYIRDTIEAGKTVNKMMLGIEIFLGFVGGLTLLIGGIGVANIMYAAVKQRTREIGVQMAMGARRSYVMGTVVLESLALTSVGGALGITIGYTLAQLLAAAQRMSSEKGLEILGEPTFSAPIALATVALLGAIGLLAGYFPSRSAASVMPAEALRHE